ncbi:MAG: SpoIIE family protein phosphatase [Leptospiraceae bacterium]|nr:SpoIIE family protein phosphatase [Leptospiraceae bacterium]
MKMILLICGVVVLSVFPLSFIVLLRNQDIITDKTIEVCRNLSHNVASSATEELLIDVTYDGTRSAVTGLQDAGIHGLLNAYVLNVDGEYVADMRDEHLGQTANPELLANFRKMKDLDMERIKGSPDLLRFVYPIFITYKGQNLRVGEAVFEFDEAQVYEPIQETRRTVFIVAGIIFGVAIIIAIATAILITRPILSLSEGASIIGSGDLSHRISISSSDEIGQLAHSFNNMTARIQDFTQNLEDKVEQRTKELNETLEQVQALKVQQDGDYFLTSLLARPLQTNKNRSNFISSEFVIEQKKKFSFRKWDSEIGGDYCITDTIRLDGRNYTVFLNADAMGKSIQGAGGALVLGAAFNATLIQAKLGKSSIQYPEIWLRDTYRDLQNIFVSFDGTMYMSMVMGLVDEETGFMYFINCEHPFTVLYRRGQASFLEEELELRKLGVPGEEEKISVKSFQLDAGDVIICGSDGRDDLITTKPDGTESINEDEFQFLRHVELCEGDIGKILDYTRSNFKLMDDISLLRISYKENMPNVVESTVPGHVREKMNRSYELIAEGKEEEALQSIKEFVHHGRDLPELLKTVGRLYFNKGDYNSAAECFKEFVSISPNDQEYLYAVSNCCRLADRLEEAADFGERLLLREPGNVLNLLNLADIYARMEQSKRALTLVDKALHLEPENEQAAFLRDSIVQRMATSNETREILELMEKGDHLYKKRQYNRALKQYEKVLDLDRTHRKAIYRAANCNAFARNYAQAVEYFGRVLALDPENYHAYNNLAVIYFEQKEYNQAFLSLQRALRIEPSFTAAQRNMAQVERMLENRGEGATEASREYADRKTVAARTEEKREV